MSAENCTDTSKLNRRVRACAPPCCEPIHCSVESKACHASQHKNGFVQNTQDANGRPLVAPNEPLKFYLTSTKSVTWNESCRSDVSWRCFRGLALFICYFGTRSDSSGNMSARHTMTFISGGRAGCRNGTISGSATTRGSSSEANRTGGGSLYSWPCSYKSFRSGSSSNGQTTWQWSEKMTGAGPAAFLKTMSRSQENGNDTGCYEPYVAESDLGRIIAAYNSSVSEPGLTRDCSAAVNVSSWRYCPGPDWPDLPECFGLSYTATGGKCTETRTSEIQISGNLGEGHFSMRGPANEIPRPGSRATITATSSCSQLGSCGDYYSGGGGNTGTGDGNNNRQGPWSPNETPDADGSSTTGYGGSGENGGGQSVDGQSQRPGYTNDPFPPLQGVQNNPASTQTATIQNPWTKPIPPTSQHPPNIHDAYTNGIKPTYPIHGGGSPTGGGGNSSNWSGTWGSTVDGGSWWYQQGTTSSGNSYAEGSYYISPGNWGYQYTEW
jgi:hypothetical protein